MFSIKNIELVFKKIKRVLHVTKMRDKEDLIIFRYSDDTIKTNIVLI